MLAFALGSLPKGSPGGGLLFQSTWLLYVIYLGPVVVLGLMAVMIAIIALNWRDIGSAMGFKMAQQRRKKRRSKLVTLIQMFVVAVAVAVLVEKPGTIFNPRLGGTNSTIADITNGSSGAANPFQGFIFPAVANFVQSEWFGIAFFGIVIVGALVLFEAVRTSLKETSEMSIEELQSRQIEGLRAAQEAIRLLDESKSDPRTRIILCFQSMLMTASRLGIPVSSDQTARELERAIRATFALKGDATGELTQLFEEARYSLHRISEEDAINARQCLEAIAEELKSTLTLTANTQTQTPTSMYQIVEKREPEIQH